MRNYFLEKRKINFFEISKKSYIKINLGFYKKKKFVKKMDFGYLRKILDFTINFEFINNLKIIDKFIIKKKFIKKK